MVGSRLRNLGAIHPGRAFIKPSRITGAHTVECSNCLGLAVFHSVAKQFSAAGISPAKYAFHGIPPDSACLGAKGGGEARVQGRKGAEPCTNNVCPLCCNSHLFHVLYAVTLGSKTAGEYFGRDRIRA